MNSLSLQKKSGTVERLSGSFSETCGLETMNMDSLQGCAAGVIVVDREGGISAVNRTAEYITGLSGDRLKGKDFNEVFRKRLSSCPEISFADFKDIDQEVELIADVRSGRKEQTRLALSVCPIKDSRKRNAALVFTFQDITRIKRLEERANRTERLAAMGEMAGTIAHEIRNPLGSIKLFSSILKEELEGEERLSELSERICSGLENIESIISNLLFFLKPRQSPDLEPIEIHEPLNDSLCFSSHQIRMNDSTKVITDYCPETLTVLADSELLKQAFLNLVLNAVQAMPGGGTLALSTTRTTRHGTGSDFVEIVFEDSGSGIPQSEISRIFDPFFTTKKKGTGLGLFIVHNIVRTHGGMIDIHASEGKGTKVVIRLPLLEERSREEDAKEFDSGSGR